MPNRSPGVAELVLFMRRAACSGDAEESRMVARSMYGALCCEAGMSKDEALAEFAAHWDRAEMVRRWQERATIN